MEWPRSTNSQGVGPAQARTPCPHCREPIDPTARVCAHCRRDATLDVLLPDPVLNPRQRYDLSRALIALSPKPRPTHRRGTVRSMLLEVQPHRFVGETFPSRARASHALGSHWNTVPVSMSNRSSARPTVWSIISASVFGFA